MHKFMRRTRAHGACLVLALTACSSQKPDDGFARTTNERLNISARDSRTITGTKFPQKASESFSATFVVSGGRRVKLNYLDDNNFELLPVNGGSATIVVGGRIFVRDSKGGPSSDSYLIAQLRPFDAVEPTDDLTELSTQTTSIPAAGVSAWGLTSQQVRDITLQAARPSAEAGVYTVAQETRLARAQWNIVNRMVPAMAMELCSNDIQSLTSWWPAELVGGQWAVLAASSGMRLDGRIGSLEKTVSIPAGSIVETAGSILRSRGPDDRPPRTSNEQ
jgi:hypothetical protein